MSVGNRFLKFTRLLHLYLGVFTAPMLLFFAITGGLQTFGLHEASHDGGSYKPPAWLASLGMLHKKQTLTVPARRPRPEAAGAGRPGGQAADALGNAPAANAGEQAGPGVREARGERAEAHAGDGERRGAVTGTPPPAQKNLLPMKIFFALVSLGLLLSTLTGIYMSYRYTRKPRVITVLLVAGVVVPIALTWF